MDRFVRSGHITWECRVDLVPCECHEVNHQAERERSLAWDEEKV